jgi:hypothetical protein
VSDMDDARRALRELRSPELNEYLDRLDVRLVPMTRAQRDLLVNPQVPGDREAVMRELVGAYDSAPVDPAADVLRAIFPATWSALGEEWRAVVLRALGVCKEGVPA